MNATIPADAGQVRNAVGLPVKWPRRIALCLSGGGYRAALFHLGAIRRLNELGLLARLDLIASVSGGSILAAHLGTVLRPWPSAPLSSQEFQTRVAAPFEAFCQRNIRTRPIVTRLLPQNWLRTDTAVNALAGTYAQHLTGLTLGELATAGPRFVLCATDLAFGVNWTFDTGGSGTGHGPRMGDYQVGYRNTVDLPLARAVAASSCFPPVFNPLNMHLDPAAYTGGLAARERPNERDHLVGGVTLSDGGVYDNLGVQPAIKHYGTLLISDGGTPFGPIGPIPRFAHLRRLKRYTSVAQRGGSAQRKQQIVEYYETGQRQGTYWGIGTPPSNYRTRDPRAYPDQLVRSNIETIRTDLDCFTEPEQAILQNHGYLQADAAARTHLTNYPGLTPTPVPAGSTPYPDWIDPAHAEPALETSSRRRLLGRHDRTH